jgi:ubiquinone/menaquinone biosynthesis C-methylase UbiE
MGTSIKFRHGLLNEKIQVLYKNPIGVVIADCGCGNGQLCSLLMGLGYDVHGFDISDEKLAFCRTQGISEHKASVCALPIEDNKIDVTVCSEVLEHLDEHEYKKALRELIRITKKEGYILITVPSTEVETAKDKRHKRHIPAAELISFFCSCKLIENNCLLQMESTGKIGSTLRLMIFKKG